jgi:hypothetical protein
MYWSEIIPLILVGTAAVFIPGYLLGWAAGVRLDRRIFGAPLLSVGTMALGAVVLGRLGVRWGLTSYALISVVLILVVLMIRWLLKRRKHAGAMEAYSSQARAGWMALSGIAGAAVGALGICLQLRDSLINPDAISQSYDNIFHLNAVRYIWETGDGSSLTLGSMTTADGSAAFYPAAWHDLVALVFSVFPDSVPAATNAVTFVVAALIWPLSTGAFALSMRRASPLLVFTATILSSAFLAFPGLMLKWGILYPNMLGYALLPAFMGVLMGAVKLILSGAVRGLWPLLPVGLLGSVAIVLGHPNALSAAAVLILPLLFAAIVRLMRVPVPGGGRWVRLALLLLCIVMCLMIWWVVRPGAENSTWPPTLSQGHAVGEFVTNSFNGNDAQWLCTLLVILGLAYLLRERRDRWLIVSWLLTGFLWTVVTSWEQGTFRTLIVGPWYNDAFRLAALTAIPGTLLAASGLTGTFAMLRGALASRANGSLLLKVGGILTFVVVLALGFSMSRSTSMQDASASIAREFEVKDDSLLLTTDELKVLDRMDDLVPDNDVVAVNPWEGSALAYALEDREVTSKHSLSSPPEDYLPLLEDLNRGEADPAVCETVNEDSVHWYLHFEDTLDIGKDYAGEYRGFDDLLATDMVTPVFTSGDVGLYRISGCDGR